MNKFFLTMNMNKFLNNEQDSNFEIVSKNMLIPKVLSCLEAQSYFKMLVFKAGQKSLSIFIF